jgi:hypothetical protein
VTRFTPPRRPWLLTAARLVQNSGMVQKTHGVHLPVAGLARIGVALLSLTLVAASNSGSSKHGRLYKWVDEKGEVHYGNSVPPEYAGQDQTILNDRGIPVGEIDLDQTPQERARKERERAAEAAKVREAALQRQRDQNLLATYLSVDEILSLRDRRLDVIDSQVRVSNQYLEGLRGKLERLQNQAQGFRPYSAREDAPPLSEHLADELVRTLNDMHTTETNLANKQQEIVTLNSEFERDIARFKELKKLEAEYGAGGFLHVAPEDSAKKR